MTDRTCDCRCNADALSAQIDRLTALVGGYRDGLHQVATAAVANNATVANSQADVVTRLNGIERSIERIEKRRD